MYLGNRGYYHIDTKFVIYELNALNINIVNIYIVINFKAADALMSFHRCVSICDQVMKSNNNNHTFESLQSVYIYLKHVFIYYCN